MRFSDLNPNVTKMSYVSQKICCNLLEIPEKVWRKFLDFLGSIQISVKLVDKSEEEEEDGKTVIREKERFSNELTLVFCAGEIAVLK